VYGAGGDRPVLRWRDNVAILQRWSIADARILPIDHPVENWSGKIRTSTQNVSGRIGSLLLDFPNIVKIFPIRWHFCDITVLDSLETGAVAAYCATPNAMKNQRILP
jgi:hypothetical protein